MTSFPSHTDASAPRLGQRFAALLYESVLLFGLLFFATALTHTLWPQGDSHPWALRIILFVVLGVYFSYCWCASGQTLAMKTWHLQLVQVNGQLPTWPKAVLRYVAAWILLLPATVLVWVLPWGWGVPLRGGSALAVWAAASLLTWWAALMIGGPRLAHDWIAGTRIQSVRSKNHLTA